MSIYPWRTKNGNRWFFKILPRVFVKVLAQVFCLCVLPWKVDWKCFHLFDIFLWLCVGWCANMFALTQGLDICSLTWQGASSLRCNSEKTSSKDFWLCSPRCSYLSRYQTAFPVQRIKYQFFSLLSSGSGKVIFLELVRWCKHIRPNSISCENQESN